MSDEILKNYEPVFFDWRSGFIEQLARDLFINNKATPKKCFEDAENFLDFMENRRKEKEKSE